MVADVLIQRSVSVEMARSSTRTRNAYEWMLELSAEGWAWEFLRRNPLYRLDYEAYAGSAPEKASGIALRWGLLQLIDPSIDARAAVAFWNPVENHSVLQLITGGKRDNGLDGVKCKVSVLQDRSPDCRHVLFSGDGLFLQLAITGCGPLNRVICLTDALPQHGRDRKFLALRRLVDLADHKVLRSSLYGRQKRGPRLAHLALVLDSHEKNPAHRAIARDIFGNERADAEWDILRDHIRRAVAVGRKLSQEGYLSFLR